MPSFRDMCRSVLRVSASQGALDGGQLMLVDLSDVANDPRLRASRPLLPPLRRRRDLRATCLAAETGFHAASFARSGAARRETGHYRQHSRSKGRPALADARIGGRAAAVSAGEIPGDAELSAALRFVRELILMVALDTIRGARPWRRR
jgi:hypothetical protein